MEVLVGSVGVFSAIYVLGYYWWVGGWRTRTKARHEAASCFMSLLHCSATTLLTGWNVAVTLQEHDKGPWQQLLRAPNTPFQNTVMEFSIAYFVVDLMHYVLFVPEEALFVLHHVATSTYMLSCRYYTAHGGLSVMSLLGLAESTGFLQNLWFLSFLAGATRSFRLLDPIFLTFFTFVRGILGPLLTWRLCAFYFAGQADTVIPRWLAYYWMSTVILAITGSLFWVSTQWARLHKFYQQSCLADAKSQKLE